MTAAKARLTCPLDCPDACSLLVTVENGRATKIEGDSAHPITRGFACSKTYRYPERAYLETRPKYPMKRLGAKGSGQWARVSWDEALDDIAANLKRVLEQHGSSSVMRYNYAGTMGLMQGSHAHALFRALDAIELEETICASAGSEAWAQTYGDARMGVKPQDVPQAELILLWGINSLTTNTHLTPFLTQARRNGARIVHIDPYQNKTSLFADEHIRIRPGTDAALALCIANILISRNLFDRAFVERTARGFDEYVRAAAEWGLERTASVTGIDSGTIERLALEYGRTTPSLIRTSYGMTRHVGGGNAQRAITMLPILMGQWQHRGGGALLSTSGFFRLNREHLGAQHLLKPQTRRVNMVQLASALEPSQSIHAMFVYNSNPVVIAPDSNRVIAGMKREDLFTVVLENAMTETAVLADYVLPATTFFEHDDLYTAYGHDFISYNRAACEPYFESRPNTWVFAELGKRLGIVEPTVYWNAEQLTRALLSGGHEWLEGITFERLLEDGFVQLNSPQLPYENGSSFTADGKFHLAPAPQFIQWPTSNQYPLRLMTPPAHHFLNSTYGELEVLNQLEGGQPHALIHPSDAVKYDINDGASVRLSSEQGSVIHQAKVTNASSPGVVIVEGTWWSRKGQDGQGINALTSERLTDIGGGSTFHDVPIRIERL
jgi:anaerobic selenocysteine-containing dehydrogenase